MGTTTHSFPNVDESLLAELVARMVAVGKPRKIILFGSRARGDAGPNSDIDLLIIEESRIPRYKRSAKYRKAVVGMFPSKDIVVWTPEEVEEWHTVSNAFISRVLREGRVLYEA